MLPQEIIQDVKENNFHIYAVKTIDDVIELMTGMKAEDFHKKVDESLEKFARTAEEFSTLKSDK